MLVVLADEEDSSGCGWLASWLAAKPKIRRAELKMYQKKTRRQASYLLDLG